MARSAAEMSKKSNRKKPNDISAGGVDAVDRAMKILSAFTPDASELSLHALANRTDFFKSTLLRILTSLQRAHMVERRPDKMYVLGPEVMRLSAVIQHNYRIADHVRPVLKHLVGVTGESSSFYVLQRDHRICLVRENSPRSIRHHAMEGDAMPLVRGGASGRILSDFRNIRADAIPKKLLRILPYVNYGEIDPDIAAVSAPVFSRDNSLAGALSITGPKHRFSVRAMAEYKALVLASAQNLSEVLGATGNAISATLASIKPDRHA